MSDEKTVLVEDTDGVRIITLNRPDRLNALNDSIMAPLADATREAAQDPAVGCVVITGAGRGFCSGGDLKGDRAPADVTPELGGPVEQGHARLRSHMETPRLLHEMGKPTIAMINGPVAGAGIGIAGACDLRFAAQSATFLSAFDRIGGGGDFGSTWFWTKILGTAKARELMFMGEKFDADAALAEANATVRSGRAAVAVGCLAGRAWNLLSLCNTAGSTLDAFASPACEAKRGSAVKWRCCRCHCEHCRQRR